LSKITNSTIEDKTRSYGNKSKQQNIYIYIENME